MVKSVGNVVLNAAIPASTAGAAIPGAILLAEWVKGSNPAAIIESGFDINFDVSLHAYDSINTVSQGVTAGLLGVKLGYYSYQCYLGNLTWEEYGKKVVETVVVDSTKYGASMTGMYLGAAAGAAIGGPIAPLTGIIGGMLGSVLAGVSCGYGVSSLVDKYWPKQNKLGANRNYHFFNVQLNCCLFVCYYHYSQKATVNR